MSTLNCTICLDYKILQKIGEGVYGVVFKAIDKRDNTTIALKTSKPQYNQYGLPMTVLRETTILHELNHENVIKLVRIFYCNNPCKNHKFGDSVNLASEFCKHDLSGVINHPRIQLKRMDYKQIMIQIFRGVSHIHENQILHRDLKPSNILITTNGVVKITDFGLARGIQERGPDEEDGTLTLPVVARWYRAPELLLNDVNYSYPIDIWSVGCIMAELWSKKPIFKGTNEINQLKLITETCGSITPETWPGVENIPNYQSINLPGDIKRKLVKTIECFVHDQVALSLIDNLLKVDPSKRITMEDCVDHDWFQKEPFRDTLKETLSKVKNSMLEYFVSKTPSRKRKIENNKRVFENHFQDRIY